MTYEVLALLKVKTPQGIRDLQVGEVITLPEDMASKLIEGGKVRPFSPDCFSLNGTLEAAFREAVEDGWNDDQLLAYVDALRKAGCLKGLWGFMVKDSPLMGDYWIISDATARGRTPAGAMSFTIEELRPIVEACRIFPGRVLKVLRHQEKETGNA